MKPTPKFTKRAGLILIALVVLLTAAFIKGYLPLIGSGENQALEEAIAEFNRAIEMEPGNVEAWLSLGRAYVLRGQVDRAIEAYGQAIHFVGDESERVYAALVHLLLDQGDHERVIDLLQQATSEDPRLTVEVLIRLGRAYVKRGRSDQAIEVYEQGIDSVRERSAHLHRELGRLLSDQGDHERAIALLQQATLVDPEDVEAWANLGLALRRQGRLEEAASAYRRALQLNPDHYWANHLLARLLVVWKNWAEVASLERRAVEVAPGDQERATSLMLLASAYIRLNYTKGVCESYRRAYEILHSHSILQDMKTVGCPSVDREIAEHPNWGTG